MTPAGGPPESHRPTPAEAPAPAGQPAHPVGPSPTPTLAAGSPAGPALAWGGGLLARRPRLRRSPTRPRRVTPDRHRQPAIPIPIVATGGGRRNLGRGDYQIGTDGAVFDRAAAAFAELPAAV